MSSEPRRLQLQRVPTRAITTGSPNADAKAAAIKLFAQATRLLATEQCELDAGMWDVLEFCPTAVESWTSVMLREELPLVDHAAEYPAAALCLMIKASSNPNRLHQLLPKLEAPICSDGEILRFLVQWLSDAAVGVSQMRYREAMLRHPLHGVQWAEASGDKTFAVQVLDWAYEHWDKYAAAIWTLMIAQNLDPEQYRALVSMDPMYMAASSARFGMKFDLEEFPEEIDGRSLYMLLANEACIDEAAATSALLRRDPFWGVEWLVRRGKPTPTELTAVVATLRDWATRRPGNPFYRALQNTLLALAEMQTPPSAAEEAGREALEANFGDEDA